MGIYLYVSFIRNGSAKYILLKQTQSYGKWGKQSDVFLTVHHSIDLFQVTNLMHNSFIL